MNKFMLKKRLKRQFELLVEDCHEPDLLVELELAYNELEERMSAARDEFYDKEAERELQKEREG